MCDVTALAIGATVGSTALGAYSQYQAGQAEGAALDRNSQIAMRKAVDAIVRGNFMAGRALSEGGREVSSFRAQASASGFDVQSEGNVAVTETIRGVAAQDAEMIKTNALREALGYEVQAQDFAMQASSARKRGKLGMIGSLLGGAASLAGSGLFKVGKGPSADTVGGWQDAGAGRG